MAAAIANRQRRVPLSLPRLTRTVARALAAVGRPAGEVEIDVVDDRQIRVLNRRFRGVRRRTDVLAFPLEIPDAPLVGQIVISADTAQRQARRVGVPLALELDLLATHGVLHLVGYDDRDPVEAALMHRREREILETGARHVPDHLWRGLLHERSHEKSPRMRRHEARRRRSAVDKARSERSRADEGRSRTQRGREGAEPDRVVERPPAVVAGTRAPVNMSRAHGPR